VRFGYFFDSSSLSSRGSGGGSFPRGFTAVAAGGGGGRAGGWLAFPSFGTGGISQRLWTGIVLRSGFLDGGVDAGVGGAPERERLLRGFSSSES